MFVACAREMGNCKNLRLPGSNSNRKAPPMVGRTTKLKCLCPDLLTDCSSDKATDCGRYFVVRALGDLLPLLNMLP